EALSRGARAAVLIEPERLALAVLRANLERAGMNERARVLAVTWQQAVARLANSDSFDLVYFDPPWRDGGGREFVVAIAAHLRPDARVIVEHPRREPIEPPPGFALVKTLRAGLGSA